MKYYPIFLRIARRPCLVIGGGPIAQQKVESLLNADADVTVISPQVTPRIAAWAAAGRLTHRARPFTPGDARGFCLAYDATGGAATSQVVLEAQEANILLNVVDRPAMCDFIAPAIMERGDLIIAASTCGTSPALAKRIRRDLEARFGAEYAVALQVLKRLRERLTTGEHRPEERRRIFTALVDSPLLDYLRAGDGDAVDRVLAACAGADVSLAALGMELQ